LTVVARRVGRRGGQTGGAAAGGPPPRGFPTVDTRCGWHDASSSVAGNPEPELPAMLTISTVTSSAWNGAALLVLQGNLDSLDAIKVGRAIDEIHAQGVGDIIVDASDLSYVSSQGWGVFVSRLYRQDLAVRFRFFGTRPTVLETLHLIGIDRIGGLSLHECFEEAVEASRREAMARATAE
jgi:anti-anti-sigma factor